MKLKYIFLIAIVALAAFLRLYLIDQIPHGLYIDEASIGYNAYTILHTGKDEFGTPFPFFFKAFGEYKMPVAIYLTSVSMAIFGKTEFAVRLPSAVFGTATVLLFYFFLKSLFSFDKKVVSDKIRETLAILGAFLLAISPWHLQFSRAGFEATIALFLYLLGGLFVFQFIKQKKSFLLILAVLSFLLTMYTYNAYRIIAPITIVSSLVFLYRKVSASRKVFWVSGFVLILAMLPFLISSGSNSRFFETSAFSEYVRLPLFLKIIWYPMIYLHNYLTYFSPSFLFATGDGIGRHTVNGMGPLFRWELPLLLVGLFMLIKQRRTFFSEIIFFLFLLAPTAAAFTQPSPHLLRSFLLVIPLTCTVAYGFIVLWQQRKRVFKFILAGILLFAIYETGYYFHLYYTHYPLLTASDWGGENKQLIQSASQEQSKYKLVVISLDLNGNVMPGFIKFYNDKLQYQQVDRSWKKPAAMAKEKVLYITTESKKENPYLQTIPHKLIKNIYLPNLNHDIVAQFWEI